MGLLDVVKAKLAAYPSITYEADDRSIAVPPASPEGFTVSLELEGPGCIVFYEGWHQHFESEEEALNCFGLGLTSACRLRVYRRGGRAYRWTMQYLKEGRWWFGGTVGLLFFPFWRRREVVVLRNDRIPIAELEGREDAGE